MHLPIDNNDLNYSNDDNQNDNDDIIDLEYSERKAKLEYYKQKIDPKIKVQEYLEQIIMNSKNYFILGKNITIDESMVFFRGKKYALRFYMPHKPIKWRFKIHSMVNSKFNFLCDIIFGAGKEWKKIINPETDKSYSRAIVNTLVDRLPKTGYHLFFDSWYSSIELLTDLNEKGYFYTTTLKPNAKNFPDKNKIGKSSIRKYAYNNTNNLLIQQYNDKNNIFFNKL